MTIGIFDSGLGGKTVEAEIRKLLPAAKIIYLADTPHFPYGEKSPTELRKICESNVRSLLTQGASLIVVACNTATTAAIDYLRITFPDIPIVGTEPAVKQACDVSSATAKILLLATSATAHSSRTAELVARFKRPHQEIIIQACPGLADAIESHDSAKIKAILSSLDAPYDIEAVILGCTHYPLIHDYIQARFPQAKLIDGGEGVAREVLRLVDNMV